MTTVGRLNVPYAGPTSNRPRFDAFGRLVCQGAYWAAAVTAPFGLVLKSPVAVCLTALWLSIAFIASDVLRARTGGVSAITVYSLSSAYIAFANVVALRAADDAARALYFVYMAEEHIYLASLLALAGTVLPVISFRMISERPGARVWLDLLPRVKGTVSDRNLVRVAVIASAFVMIVETVGLLPPIGTLSSILHLAPHFAVVVLARAGMERRVPGAVVAALVIAIAEAVRSFFFEYLRAAILSPLAAFMIGAVVGARSLKPLRTAWFIPVYAVVAMFVTYFAAFGEIRARSAAGVVRLAELQEYQDLQAQQQLRPQQTVLSRATTLNQLSQVGRVVEEDGFLEGETLEYLAYAFIPRVIWAEKPVIAKGAWFALRIGQANVGPTGQIHNSVNMTIPGELYLNFGWLGVVTGLVLVGALLGILWSRIAFWEPGTNALGTALGFYLMWIWVGFSLGADLQILVTMIAIYMIFVMLGAVLSQVDGRRRA